MAITSIFFRVSSGVGVAEGAKPGVTPVGDSGIEELVDEDEIAEFECTSKEEEAEEECVESAAARGVGVVGSGASEIDWGVKGGLVTLGGEGGVNVPGVFVLEGGTTELIWLGIDDSPLSVVVRIEIDLEV